MKNLEELINDCISEFEKDSKLKNLIAFETKNIFDIAFNKKNNGRKNTMNRDKCLRREKKIKYDYHFKAFSEDIDFKRILDENSKSDFVVVTVNKKKSCLFVSKKVIDFAIRYKIESDLFFVLPLEKIKSENTMSVNCKDKKLVYDMDLYTQVPNHYVFSIRNLKLVLKNVEDFKKQIREIKNRTVNTKVKIL